MSGNLKLAAFGDQNWSYRQSGTSGVFFVAIADKFYTPGLWPWVPNGERCQWCQYWVLTGLGG